jgi:hypothetical protein
MCRAGNRTVQPLALSLLYRLRSGTIVFNVHCFREDFCLGGVGKLDSPAHYTVTDRQTDRARTVVTAVVQQDHLLDQIGRRSVQHAATKSAVLRLWSSGI